ncbi:hypothetical protein RJ640_009703 [Escallonia rubra]|uniref:Growth-regulating factor n=1 Tax=Escallonia rubra TaxID=112253 RepID=A0AA88QQN2_9ASTE|nr:hypothetical protein RJ640_009703 [Escallonia rubra]
MIEPDYGDGVVVDDMPLGDGDVTQAEVNNVDVNVNEGVCSEGVCEGLNGGDENNVDEGVHVNVNNLDMDKGVDEDVDEEVLAGLKRPFTPSQWKELEIQALIYKYITAYAPIPSNLLIPIRKALESAGFSGFPGNHLRPSILVGGRLGGGEVEPWPWELTVEGAV